MNTYMRCMIAAFFLSSSVYAQQGITLEKVYFHQGAAQNEKKLGVGTMLLYFSQKPRVESSVVTKNKRTLQVLFFPNVTVSKELESTLETLQERTKNQSYSIRSSVKASPTRKGLEIALMYPTQAVGVKYDHFQTMKLQKGVEIQLYNKKMVQAIKRVGKNIITTASVSPARVIVDCGHGGSDCGAVSHSLQEKNLTLAIGRDVAQQLRSQGVQVALSRDADIAVPLDIRTSAANSQNADLFVSIHANATTNPIAHGIETYFFDPSLFTHTGGDSSPINTFVQECNKTSRAEKSKKSNVLASCIHDTLLKTVRSTYMVKDRQIKLGEYQVLLGTQMPSVLVEVGFITHPQEARLLSLKPYQQKIASGIASGIMHYLKRA